MSATQKPQRAFLAVTLITVIAVTLVFMVYAVLLKSLLGGLVTITPIDGQIKYATSTGGTWGTTLTQGAGTQWYTMIDGMTGNPNEQVKVTWTLETSPDGVTDWTHQQTLYTWMTLTTSTTEIYASSSNGTITGIYNWG
jgi:hypothetical protein